MAKPTKSGESSFDEKLIRSATQIEPIAINEEFVRLPGDLAYWNGVYADAVRNLLDAQRLSDAGEARIREGYRAKVTEKVTEKYLDSCVAMDADFAKLREAEDDAEANKARAAGIVDAIRAKREMLVSLGAHMRAEMQPGPTINTMERRLEELERRAERHFNKPRD
jgi:hypothetical protein